MELVSTTYKFKPWVRGRFFASLGTIDPGTIAPRAPSGFPMAGRVRPVVRSTGEADLVRETVSAKGGLGRVGRSPSQGLHVDRDRTLVLMTRP